MCVDVAQHLLCTGDTHFDDSTVVVELPLNHDRNRPMFLLIKIKLNRMELVLPIVETKRKRRKRKVDR